MTSSTSRFFRANFVLWSAIGLLVLFGLLAKFIPAHFILVGVVVALLLTRQRHRSGDSHAPSHHPNAVFGDDVPEHITDCLWCAAPLIQPCDDHFCVGTDCDSLWAAAAAAQDSTQ